jgi:DNA-repair protein complementing XP-A cells
MSTKSSIKITKIAKEPPPMTRQTRSKTKNNPIDPTEDVNDAIDVADAVTSKSATSSAEIISSGSPAEEDPVPTTSSLTQEQRDRMEVNRKRAVELRKLKQSQSKPESQEEPPSKIAKLSQLLNSYENKKSIDTGAGFYLDEEDLIEEKKKELNIVEDPPVPPQDEHLLCDKCHQRFPHSYLSINYEVNVCDSCRIQFTEEFKLMTRTDAKEEYLLKDCDFDFREPTLKYVVKRNPHHKGWNEMKLYLKFQCEKRALEVWGSLEKIEERKEERLFNVQQTRQKVYEKKLTKLRKEARLGSKKTVQYHEHEYDKEVYDEENDVYRKACKTCEFVLEYEEL